MKKYTLLPYSLEKLVLNLESVKQLRARIAELEALPDVFAHVGLDVWFSIFCHIEKPVDLLACYRVCRTWKDSIYKYMDRLQSMSSEYREMYDLLQTKWPDVPLYVRTLRNRVKLYYLLMPRSQQYWIVLLHQVVNQNALTFENGNKTVTVKHTDGVAKLILELEVSILCICSFRRLEFGAGDMDPRMVSNITLMGHFKGRRARCSIHFVHQAK
jgi:hypothetical protein